MLCNLFYRSVLSDFPSRNFLVILLVKQLKRRIRREGVRHETPQFEKNT